MMRATASGYRMIAIVAATLWSAAALAAGPNGDVDRAVARGLEWLAAHQSRLGHWTASGDTYPTAMTALAGIALLCEGSTTTQGKYAPNIRKAVDYLVSHSRSNGLIGDPDRDDRYTYGHGFSMLFLSQVLGEEEDAERREQLVDVLTRAVQFTGRAQTSAGGWGYVSAKDGDGFDEGSTTITQVQGCAAAATPASPCPRKSSTRPSSTSRTCTGPDGGVRYNLPERRRRRPPAHHRRRHRLPVQRRRLRQRVRPQAAGVLPEEPRQHIEPGHSATGTTPTTTTPRSCTARAARSGRTTATRSFRAHRLARPAATARGTRATSARSTPRPST